MVGALPYLPSLLLPIACCIPHIIQCRFYAEGGVNEHYIFVNMPSVVKLAMLYKT